MWVLNICYGEWGRKEGQRVRNGHSDTSYSAVENKRGGPWIAATREDNSGWSVVPVVVAESQSILAMVGAQDKRSRAE